jgi:hypothetical protein
VRAFPPTGTAFSSSEGKFQREPEIVEPGSLPPCSTERRPAYRLDQFSVSPLRLGQEAATICALPRSATVPPPPTPLCNLKARS